MTFSTITDVFIVFQPHPHDPKAHIHLNNVYSDCITDPGRLYVDPTTQDEVKDTAALLSELRRIITFEIIAPNATMTANANTDIEAKINQAALFVTSGNNQSRLNKASLTRALNAAVSTGKDNIEIRVSLAHVYFDTSGGPLNYLDWSLLTTSVIPVATPPAPATAADIALAVASSMPLPLHTSPNHHPESVPARCPMAVMHPIADEQHPTNIQKE